MLQAKIGKRSHLLRALFLGIVLSGVMSVDSAFAMAKTDKEKTKILTKKNLKSKSAAKKVSAKKSAAKKASAKKPAAKKVSAKKPTAKKGLVGRKPSKVTARKTATTAKPGKLILKKSAPSAIEAPVQVPLQNVVKQDPENPIVSTIKVAPATVPVAVPQGIVAPAPAATATVVVDQTQAPAPAATKSVVVDQTPAPAPAGTTTVVEDQTQVKAETAKEGIETKSENNLSAVDKKLANILQKALNKAFNRSKFRVSNIPSSGYMKTLAQKDLKDWTLLDLNNVKDLIQGKYVSQDENEANINEVTAWTLSFPLALFDAFVENIKDETYVLLRYPEVFKASLDLLTQASNGLVAKGLAEKDTVVKQVSKSGAVFNMYTNLKKKIEDLQSEYANSEDLGAALADNQAEIFSLVNGVNGGKAGQKDLSSKERLGSKALPSQTEMGDFKSYMIALSKGLQKQTTKSTKSTKLSSAEVVNYLKEASFSTYVAPGTADIRKASLKDQDLLKDGLLKQGMEGGSELALEYAKTVLANEGKEEGK